MVLSRSLILPGVVHAVQIIGVDVCLLVQRVYGERESMVLQSITHNECTRYDLKHSSCSHQWWETLKCSIFAVKPSIPARRGPGGAMVVAPAEKASLLCSQFDSKQCRELFVTLLSCFPQSSCNSLTFQTHVLLRLLLDLDTCGGVTSISKDGCRYYCS